MSIDFSKLTIEEFSDFMSYPENYKVVNGVAQKKSSKFENLDLGPLGDIFKGIFKKEEEK